MALGQNFRLHCDVAFYLVHHMSTTNPASTNPDLFLFLIECNHICLPYKNVNKVTKPLKIRLWLLAKTFLKILLSCTSNVDYQS